MKATKCYAYVRVSSTGQAAEDRDGFPRQMAAISTFAKANGFEIVRDYRDALGGDNEWQSRPAFSEMVGAILDNGVRTVIVENLSRFARAYVVQEHILLWLASKDITLISADSGEDITAAVRGDPVKKLVIQMMGILFEYEKNALVRKLRAARARKREATGRCEGRKPYGFHPGEGAAIARAAAWRAAGHSYDRIARMMDEAGLPSRGGKPWTGGAVRRILLRPKG